MLAHSLYTGIFPIYPEGSRTSWAGLPAAGTGRGAPAEMSVFIRDRGWAIPYIPLVCHMAHMVSRFAGGVTSGPLLAHSLYTGIFPIYRASVRSLVWPAATPVEAVPERSHMGQSTTAGPDRSFSASKYGIAHISVSRFAGGDWAETPIDPVLAP